MEQLETDVMRFMAILAFCLVAIFALVQSMPLDTPVTTQAPPLPAPKPAPVVVQQVEAMPVPEPPAQVETPVRRERPPAPVEVVVAAAPELEAPPVVEPPPSPPAALADEQVGFTLRFESDDALKALIARNQVQLFAMDDARTWRALWAEGGLSFQPAPRPTQLHEMTTQTVPGDALGTLRRRAVVDPRTLKWGVTLPASTTRELRAVIERVRGGDLVIDAAAQLRLESGS